MQVFEYPEELKGVTTPFAAIAMATQNIEQVKKAYKNRDYGLNWILTLSQANWIIEQVLNISNCCDYKSPNRPLLREEIVKLQSQNEDAIICSQGLFLYYDSKSDKLYGTLKNNDVEISRIWIISKK